MRILNLNDEIKALNLNLINVKLARASVDILGTIKAGGSVRAEAQVDSSIGYVDGKEVEGLPLAVSVATLDTGVNVHEGALIEAGRAISLSSKADLRVNTRADSGLGGLPASVAVAVLISDVNTVVNGTLKTAVGDIRLSAQGVVSARTIADKGDGQKSLSGGYGAVSVVLQDVLAEIGKKAVVTAAGDVKTFSLAREKVDNRAAANKQDIDDKDDSIIDQGISMIFGLLQDKVWPWIKEKLNKPTAEEKLQKAMEQVSSSDKSVQLDEDAEKKGQVTASMEQDGNAYKVTVKVTPWDGYKVKEITLRGYNPGESSYTILKGTSDGVFKLSKQYVTVFVEYEEDSAYDNNTAADLFDEPKDEDDVDIQKVLDEVEAMEEEQRLEDELGELGEEIKLKLEGGGAVLNYDADENGKSIDSVYAGQSLRLVPNPKAGKVLKQGGLTVTYKIPDDEEEDKLVEKTVIVEPDSKNRYLFTVPENADVESELTVKAEFVDSGSHDASANTTQTQVTGAVAVVVSENNNESIIDSGAQVKADGSVSLDAIENTNISNLADGTAAGKPDGGSGGGGGAQYPISRPKTKTVSDYPGEGTEYSLLLSETENGTVSHERDTSNSAKYYTYTFTATPAAGYSVANAILIYYTDDGRETLTLTPDTNGKYAVDLGGITDDGKPVALKSGSIAQVKFAFTKKGVYDETVSTQEEQAIIPNAIKLSYNAITEGKGNDEKTTSIGKVYYKGTSTNGGATSYVFQASPEKTYILDGSLTASWTAEAGIARSKELVEKNGLWYLDPTGIPAGAQITVSAAFKDDLHSFRTGTKAENGTVTLYDAQVKSTDTPKLTVKPDAGFSVSEITVTYVSGTGTKTLTLSGEKLEDARAKDGNNKMVSVVSSENRATVKGSVSSGENVRLNAILNGSAKTETKAGYSKSNIGVGGAVAVQVASMNSKSLIYKGANVALDGKLSVGATGNVNYNVNADASGNKEAGEVGVGAAIAVAVDGSDVFAAVQDGAKLANRTSGKNIRAISLSARQEIHDSVTAKAGAAGGTAAVPVATVDVMGAAAVAQLGKTRSGLLQVGDKNVSGTGTVSITAQTETEHSLNADASAAGKGAGIGGAFAVSVISDAARAVLNQSISANQVSVAADTASSMNSTATASASGGKSSGGSPDAQANGLLGGAANLAGQNRSSLVSSGSVDKAITGRQPAETSEGSIAVAGAVVVNVQSSESRAEIADGVDVNATGAVSVEAENGTISKVKANASTTNSDVGVGVGVAVNVVNIDNIAHIGNGELRAATLKVSATTKEIMPEEEDEIPQTVDSYDELALQLSEMVQEYVEKLVREMGLDEYVSADLLSSIVGSVTKEVAQSLIDSMGLRELIGEGGLSAKYENVKSMFEDSKNGLLSLPQQLVEPFMDALGDVMDIADMSDKEREALKTAVIDEFTRQFRLQLQKAPTAMIDSLKEGMLNYLKDKGGDLLSGLFGGKIKASLKKVVMQVKDETIKVVKKQLKTIVNESFQETLKNLNVPGLTVQNQDLALKAFNGARTSYANGSIDNILGSMGDYVSDTFRTQVFDYEKVITSVSQTDFAGAIKDSLQKAAKTAMVTLTNEAIGALTDHFDLKLEATSDPEGHVIDTQAISGAGARGVGVAGSVAVTVLNANTSATVAESSKAFAVTGDVVIEAKELRSVKNVASAALDANGDASANKSADDEANADVADGVNTVTGKHVSLELGAGATGVIREADKNDDRPKITVTVQDGYKLPNKASYSYTGSDGQEKTGTIAVTKSGDLYVIDTKSGDLAGIASDIDVRLKLTPEEILNALPTPEVLSPVSVPKGTVSVSVVGREAENGKLSAREGDVIELKVLKGEGRKVASLGYSYTDENGKNHDVEIITDPDADPNSVSGKEKNYTLKSNSSTALVELGNKATIRTNNSNTDIDIHSKAAYDLMLISGSANVVAGTGKVAAGGTVNVNVFDREATVSLQDGTLTAGRNLAVQASGRDTTVMVGLALAGSVTGAAVSGNVGVLVESNRVHTIIAKGVTATAGGNAIFESYYSDFTVDAAGTIAVAGTSAAVGATLVTVVKDSDIRTLLGASSITALGGNAVKADDDTRQILLAGGVSVSANMGAGAAVTTLVSDKTVKALAHNLQARGDIAVKAGNKDDMTTIAVNAGISGSVAVHVGASVQVLSTDVLAQVDGTVKSRDAGVSILADNDTKLLSLAGAAAGSGTAAVSAVGAVTEFSGSTQALVKEGSSVFAGRDVNVRATANKNIDIYSASVAIGGVGVSGTANVVVTKDSTAAAAEANTAVRSKIGTLNIESQSDYALSSATVAIVGGSAAASLNGGIARNNTKNYVTVIGDRTISVDGTTTLHGKGQSSAQATLTGLNVGVKSVAATVVVALNDADARTTVVSNGFKAKGGLILNATQKGVTNARAITGGGSIVGGKLTLVLAYGRTDSVIDVAISGGGNYAYLKSTNTASDDTKAAISNASIDLISASAMFGGAYSQDVFSTSIQLTGGDYTVGGADVLMDYDLKTTADVAPSNQGVDVSLGKLAANIAIAKSTAYAGTDLEFSIPATKSTVNGNVNVKTLGSDVVTANVSSAEITVSGISLGANIARADLSATQSAVFRLGGSLTINGDLDVESLSRAAKADAAIGANTVEGLNVSLANLGISVADARENLSNTAGILGAAYKTDEVDALVDIGYYELETVTDYDYELIDTITFKMKDTGWESSPTVSEEEAKRELMDYYYWDASDNEIPSWRKSVFAQAKKEYDSAFRYMWEYSKLLKQKYPKLTTSAQQKAWTREWNFANIYGNNGTYNTNGAKQRLTEVKGEMSALDAYDYITSLSFEEFGEVFGSYYGAKKGDELGIFEWEEIPHFQLTSKDVLVWHPVWESMKVQVPVYNAESNKLTVGSLKAYAGMDTADGKQTQTRADARTNGAKNIGLLSVGSLSSTALVSDAVSTLLEGMRVYPTGDVSLIAEGNAAAEAIGYKSGNIELLDVDLSEVKSGLGTRKDRQSVSVVVGDNVQILWNGQKADFTVIARNLGNAVASMDQEGVSVAVGSFKSATQTTDSWYNTLISFGQNVLVRCYGETVIRSEDVAGAVSTVESASVGIAMNFNTMFGDNTVHQENNIDFGNDTKFYIYGDDRKVTIEALQSTRAHAETVAFGGSFIEGTTVTAKNTIDRTVRVNMGIGAILDMVDTDAVMRAISGVGDDIYTRAYAKTLGLIAMGQAKAYADVTSNAEVIIGDGSQYTGRDTVIEAIATSYSSKGDSGNLGGIRTIATVDNKGLVPLPQAVARNNLNFNTYVNINESEKQSKDPVIIIGRNITVFAGNTGLSASTQATAEGMGAVGIVNATALNYANLYNTIWVDNAQFRYNRELKLLTTNGGSNPEGESSASDKTHLSSSAFTALSGLGGKVAPTARVSGVMSNQIRSNQTSWVTFYNINTNSHNENAIHIARAPSNETVQPKAAADYERWEIDMGLFTLTLTKASVVHSIDWYVYDRCEFCDDGKDTDVDATPQDPMRARYKAAYDAAMSAIARIRQMAGTLGSDPAAEIAMRLAKGLAPLKYLNTLVQGLDTQYKARYGEEDDLTAAAIYVLDIRSMLEKDVRLTADQLTGYRLWTDALTQHDVFLLPNATRLYTNAAGRLEFVSEVLQSGEHKLDVITALTGYAFSHPTVPIGSSGSLEMDTGILTIPAQAEFELYLNEVSGAWLLEQLGAGFIRRLDADQEAINRFARGEGELPEGELVEGLTPDGEQDGWHIYWLTDTPETAASDDQVLIFLLYNEQTDEIDAYRISRRMLANGDMPVDVSVYFYRDSRSDRMGIVRYNLAFFDTAEGDESLVVLVTDVPEEREMDMPMPLEIVLRGFDVGADLPAYSLTGHFFVMLDGSDGYVSAFDGFYQATFDGDTFESDYTRIEGIRENAPEVTVKADQAIWPEWTGEKTAEDIEGKQFELSYGLWYPIDDTAELFYAA